MSYNITIGPSFLLLQRALGDLCALFGDPPKKCQTRSLAKLSFMGRDKLKDIFVLLNQNEGTNLFINHPKHPTNHP